MRLFQNLEEAIPEIRRDISKSPKVHNTRVQAHTGLDLSFTEAANYAYTILPGGVPDRVTALSDLYSLNFPDTYTDTELSDLRAWASGQSAERTLPTGATLALDQQSDDWHPRLTDHREGRTFSYLYGLRLARAVSFLANTLYKDLGSRRAYWPIFWPEDALKAAAPTRIPCSLGYQVYVREVPDVGPALHITYISRSCDFEKFWLSDIWMAHKFREAVRIELASIHNIHISSGGTTHFIVSLHRFDDDTEIF